MLKGGKRVAFEAPTTLNAPVVLHATGEAQHVSKDEVLEFLDGFISEKESLIGADGSAGSINGDISLSTALSQLKRIQRDFKGLPPIVLVEGPDFSSAGSNDDDSVTKIAATGGKKTKFTDE